MVLDERTKRVMDEELRKGRERRADLATLFAEWRAADVHMTQEEWEQLARTIDAEREGYRKLFDF